MRTCISSPSWRSIPDIAYGYVIEVKYLKRSERVDDSVVAETVRGAREQLAGYLADDGLRRRAPSVRYVGLAVGVPRLGAGGVRGGGARERLTPARKTEVDPKR